MRRAPVDGLELEYEDRGTGEPVVLIHAGVCADFFAPLMDEPALAGHRLVRHRRAGYAGSGRVEGSLGIERQAEHCRALMAHLGIERAHVVGHSSGACVALQLALDAPEAVQSLALLEPAKPGAPSLRQQELVETIFRPALGHYQAGDLAAAVDVFMRGVCGAGYRARLEAALPGAFEQAVADAGTFFGQELPAVMAWSLGSQEAARIVQPTLVVRGGDSLEVYRERQDLLAGWLPDAEPFVLPGATHLLHVQEPRAMAEALAGFLSRHSG